MKRALVTGGSRGLGLAICRDLLASGWEVVTCARRGNPVVEDLRAQCHPHYSFHEVDLSQPGAVELLASRAGLIDGVDAFVANAALGTEGLLTLTSERAIRECLEVNLAATILLTREVVKGMLARGGSLVFVSSVAARTGFSGLSVYAATKGALVSFSKVLAREYGGRGIRSNCVLPGFLETDMSATLSVEQRERLRRRSPLGRLGAVGDVVGAVRYLLSDEARFVTGTELVVDGGFSA
jgi:3-oxoacyl-[acyl-carrier protein] reductase